ncbi:MAG: ATP-binding cassette domain-containing protein, partial [Candidatus Melainabacteria bacterium]|nr:ATP-binding cassette domain-containing protein [Candidatus Melainabacteria bacterium]
MQCINEKAYPNLGADYPVLIVSELSFAYPNQSHEAQRTLSGVSFMLRPGEILGLIGPSGCGKTTLLNVLAGLLEPSAGEIKIRSDSGAGRIGYIFQSDALLPWRTVKDNLLLVSEIVPHSRALVEAKISEYLRVFHLKPEHLDLYPSQLSGGMRQRVSIIQS